MKTILDLSIEPQIDGVTCGPTCLHALYRYLGEDINLNTVIQQVPYLDNGGTLAILLGCHALQRGYAATIYNLNMDIIDPSWIRLDSQQLIAKLNQQITLTKNKKIADTTRAYIQFLESGGTLISYTAMTEKLISDYLLKGIPLLSGISATFLYQNMRDYTGDNNQVVYDEFLGEATGHFVVIHGYDQKNQQLYLADPYLPHSLSQTQYYTVSFSHWLHAHLLGSMTYDAELLVLEK